MSLIEQLSMYTPMALVAVIVFLKMREARRSDEEDGLAEVEMTTLAKLSRRSRTQFDPLAAMSANSQADTTLGDTILRPSLPMRLLSLGLTGLAFAFLFLPMGEEIRYGIPEWVIYGIAAFALYAVIFVQTAETRFSRDVIIGRGALFQRIEKRWQDLVRIQDDGQHYFVLKFTDGSKLQVLKHSRGVEGFLRYARQRLAANLRGEAAPQTDRIRFGGSVLGQKKTFY